MINCLCQALKFLSKTLETLDDSVCVSQDFRDAYACHLYMLFSVMFVMESEAKHSSQKKNGNDKQEDMRAICADAMLQVSQAMACNKHKLWKRGVPEETVVVLPCRIAYQMLEGATGVIARKAASADAAMAMIAHTLDSCEALLGTILAALMDMLHSYEHMASICCELCTITKTNRLSVELLKEIGRLDTSSSSNDKASGIKYVAPFLSELAVVQPRLVLGNISHILPHLNCDPYYLRSAIVTALGHIVQHISKSLASSPGESHDEEQLPPQTLEKNRASLLEILVERSHDVSSYTRSAVLKAWISLVQANALPIPQTIPVTILATDRLKDKTVMVRKQALQVRNCIAYFGFSLIFTNRFEINSY